MNPEQRPFKDLTDEQLDARGKTAALYSLTERLEVKREWDLRGRPDKVKHQVVDRVMQKLEARDTEQARAAVAQLGRDLAERKRLWGKQ